MTPLFGLGAVVTYAASLATADWLRTEEKMPNHNRTVLFGPDRSPEYLPKMTTSGLFALCYTSRKFEAHIITSNYLQLFYSFQPIKLLLAA